MGKLSMDLYLDNMLKRYRTANKREKGELLDELCAASGYHKKHAIRLLNKRKKKAPRQKERRGRPKRYPIDIYLEPLKNIWLSTDQLCGKRLQMALLMWSNGSEHSR